MNRYKPVGWRHESYRHYLAAKGIKTRRKSYQQKYKDLVKNFPGENPRMTEEYARFRQRDPDDFVEGSFRTKEVAKGKKIILGKLKSTGKMAVQSVLLDRKYFAWKYDPMRPVETREIPKGDQWIAERKWDGSRMSLQVEDGKIELVNRRGVRKEKQFPELTDEKFKDDVVLDGEVIVPEGKEESFKLLSSREHLKDKEKIKVAEEKYPARFMAFDILKFNGKDVRKEPLKERKRLLGQVVSSGGDVRVVGGTKKKEEFVKEMKRRGAEGVVFKDENSPYVHGRSKHWRKLKFKTMNDVVVTGYEPGKGKRSGMIGAVYISVNGKPVGKVGTGFSDEENRKLKKLLDAGKHPVIRVEFRGKGSRGNYREPVYVGLRSDITRKQVHEVKA